MYLPNPAKSVYGKPKHHFIADGAMTWIMLVAVEFIHNLEDFH